ncbi:MAG: hypothetical protein WCN95_01995 [bacterium]
MNKTVSIVITCVVCSVITACDSGSDGMTLGQAGLLVDSGQGVSDAAGFVSGQTPHKFIPIDHNNSVTLSGGDWPANWFASSVSELQIVLCQTAYTYVPKERDGFYWTSTINGESVTQAVEETWVLRDARTGQDIASRTFAPSPQNYEMWWNLGSGTPRHWFGVSTATIVEWARPYIEQ